MALLVLIGAAAGFTSALLFASISSGSLLSIPLFNLAPLPVLIAALGWSHVAGLIAALAAGSVLGAVFGALLCFNYILGVGLPAWWLAYLVVLARPGRGDSQQETLQWYPLGNIAIWVGLVSAGVVTLVLLSIATNAEDLRASLARTLSFLLRGSGGTGEGVDLDPSSARLLLRFFQEAPERVLPPAAAMLTTLMQALMLWLAARSVRLSGRLRRPWPSISGMAFPPGMVPVVAAAVAASFLPGMPGILASVLAAGFLTSYALLGMAVMHSLTRGVNARGVILGSIYGSVAVLGWPLLLLSALGLADAGLDLRAQAPKRTPPPLEG